MINTRHIRKNTAAQGKSGREKLALLLFAVVPLAILAGFIARFTFSTASYLNRARGAMEAGDPVKGFELYMTAVNRGDMYAISRVIAARRFWSVEQYQRFLRLVERKAEAGDAVFQNVMGELCANGYGVRQNYGAALEWLKKSAAQGNTRSQYNIGIFYLNGYGVFADQRESLVWFGKAAAGGSRQAAEMLVQVQAMQARVTAAQAGAAPAPAKKPEAAARKTVKN
ncbi:MAG: tetratricopeptide repeat protein [Elusimicrobiaceae bacterium]|nr:tetratricopeptide repeat protein [Elusimicrobiaceae bacterium]